MRRQSFCFYDQELAPGIGHYSVLRLNDALNDLQTEVVTKPFRALWEEVYTGAGSVEVLFWYEGSDRFNMDVALSTGEELTLTLNLSVAGVELMEEAGEMEHSKAEVKKRLNILLSCSQSLYDLCQPCTGELYWEFAGCQYAPWASFGEPPKRPSAERPPYRGRETKLVVKLMGEVHGERQKYMYVLDPVPVPAAIGEEWNFLSLFEEGHV